MFNPYKNVDFASCIPIVSISHAHATTQAVFNRLYAGGCRHMAISNYRPSVPYYPLPYGNITDIPSDAIACPNAEHFAFTGLPDVHCNGMGVVYSSGTESSGWKIDWKSGFTTLLSNLLYPDGGGITINHPAWTNRNQINLSAELAERMLDFDDRVLGVEAITAYERNQARGTDWWDSRDFWDEILLTGRRCLGFAVPDHGAEAYAAYGLTGEEWTGQNVLLLPSNSATTGENANHSCLKAYRNGEFYCRVKQGTFAFTNISVSGHTLSASTNSGTKIRFIEDGNATEYNGTSASHIASDSSVYCRIEAEDSNDNLLLSQAIIFREFRKPQKANMGFKIALLG